MAIDLSTTMKRPTLFGYSLCVLCLMATSPHAEEGERGLAVGGVFSPSVQSDLGHGWGVRLDGEWGLGEVWSLVAGAMWVRHGTGELPEAWLAGLDTGFQAQLDMLVVVPTFQLSLGWLARGMDAGGLDSGLGVRVAVGIDYLWTESWSLGAQLAFQALLSAPDALPRYLTLSVRLGHRWLE